MKPRGFLLRVWMTLERANKLLLMLDPSLKRIPSFLVLETPSLPARSTKLSYENLSVEPLNLKFNLLLPATTLDSIETLNTQ